MINVEELTIAQMREITSYVGQRQVKSPWNIGGKYFIRTVTHHHAGILVEVGPQELVLERASWIADDGRLTEALKTCNFNEVEMFPENSRVIIGRSSVIDAVEINSYPHHKSECFSLKVWLRVVVVGVGVGVAVGVGVLIAEYGGSDSAALSGMSPE